MILRTMLIPASRGGVEGRSFDFTEKVRHIVYFCLMKRTRLGRERRMVHLMILLYCRGHEGNRTLCPQCRALLSYALSHLSACRYGEGKPSCRRCPVHCYRPDMRQRMRAVMRYAGPRIFFRHPFYTLCHLFR